MTKKESADVKIERIEQIINTAVARFTRGFSPASLQLAFMDWLLHLSIHPAKQFELMNCYKKNITEFLANKTIENHTCQFTLNDSRFQHPLWQQFPYKNIYQFFLLQQACWHLATTGIKGVSKHHEKVVDFTIRQWLDIFSPANFLATNPEIQQATFTSLGINLLRGLDYFITDVKRYQCNEPPLGSEKFVIGENVAATPGKVIYRNRLIELIQYQPTTDKVHAKPILITPAWIMKYYILDLTNKYSLVKYLVEKGHTVFMISWKNPDQNDKDLGMTDYLELGIFASLNTINHIIPKHKIHLVGYCLGGTLAAIAAATLAREADHRLASLTLLAAQTDFTEPGELDLFIDESQITFLENMMKEKGYLDTHQMAGAFQLLRSKDLIWSRMVSNYLLGLRQPLNAITRWNADATRLPYRMHSEYLRNLFLQNQLAEHKYQVNGRIISLNDITIPIFVVATEKDHISPWASVFKINLLTSSKVRFVLTSGGHNVGIVRIPSKKTKRYYRIDTLEGQDHYINHLEWYQQHQPIAGSWWPAWQKWLAKQSALTTLPTIGNQNYPPLTDAPGSYVLMK